MKNLRTLAPALLVTALGTLASASHAAAIDVSEVVSEIAAQAAPIASIGAAILLVVVGIAAFKWVRRAIS